MNNKSHITVRTDQGPVSLLAGSTLATLVAQLLVDLPQQPESVATAVNGQFVARGARTSHVLNEGDTVLCFSPITGG
ncbi:MAG: MoaD/ThiS family protein [Aquabacterium sp.]|nr:MoaD/ThiS family protein [Aquabacterium sp.]